ncbi:MAG: YicC/YloC family endoribonuclease [Cyclobacteriaceae bacterium]
MLRSMTGYGSVRFSEGGKHYSAEVKSLNSKFLDLSIRLPKYFSELESDFRNILTEKIERGKVSLTIEVLSEGTPQVLQSINKELFLAYFSGFKSVADAAGVSADQTIFQMAMNAPDVQIGSARDIMSAEEKDLLLRLVGDACASCDEFRLNEGRVLQEKLSGYISLISEGLEAVAALDPSRIERVREKLKGGLKEWFGHGDFDSNRLEQEMVYYIERLDIQEERVRLRAHLDYFIQTMTVSKASGRKLAFISQEIGREINTIGSKASDASIQAHVVVMKEELEKIKEQLNNIL